MDSDAKGKLLSTAPRYRLDDLLIDVARRQVLRGTTAIALPGLSFDLLLELVRAAPNLLSYDELMQRVWPGLVVSSETITQRVKLVRDALGDDARAPRYIKGIHGRGYLVIGRVEVLQADEPSWSSMESTSRDRSWTNKAKVLACDLCSPPSQLRPSARTDAGRRRCDPEFAVARSPAVRKSRRRCG
jgi:DNA-binding winged helix-turn-helix (wHTH) protein